MKIKFLIAGIIMLLISLNSCDDKTQTTQTQTKSDVNLLLSPNPVTDSIQAGIILPRLIGYIMNNTSDSITSVNYYSILTDTTDGNTRKFMYLKYNNQYSVEKHYLIKYYDLNDLDANGNPMDDGHAGTGLAVYRCEGECGCMIEISNVGLRCMCTSLPAGACNLYIGGVNSYSSNDLSRGASMMMIINITTFTYQSGYLIVQTEN